MGDEPDDSGFDPEALGKYQQLPPEVLELARTLSNNKLKQAQTTQLTIRIVAIGAFLLAALIVWWAWAVRETFQSSLAIAIVAYLFAGGLFQSLMNTWRSRPRRSDDDPAGK